MGDGIIKFKIGKFYKWKKGNFIMQVRRSLGKGKYNVRYWNLDNGEHPFRTLYTEMPCSLNERNWKELSDSELVLEGLN